MAKYMIRVVVAGQNMMVDDNRGSEDAAKESVHV